MKSTKKVLSVILIYAIIAVLLIVSTLAIPFAKSPASWVAFGFAIASIVGGCAITMFAFGRTQTFKSKLYGYPVFKIGLIYTIVQLVATIVLYIIGALVTVPFWVGLVVSVPILGLAAIGVIATDNARDLVEEVDEKLSYATKAIKRFNIDIADILDACGDEGVRASLKKLADRFKYSDVVSTDETAPIEEQIQNEVDELKIMIQTENPEALLEKIEVISKMLSTRNRKCEDSKRN